MTYAPEYYGGTSIEILQPLSVTVSLPTFYIGDDYLGTRRLAWSVVNPPSVPVSCHLSFERQGVKYLQTIGTVIPVSATTYTLAFEFSRALTDAVPEGTYDYSVEIRNIDGHEITVVHSITGRNKALWLKKYT